MIVIQKQESNYPMWLKSMNDPQVERDCGLQGWEITYHELNEQYFIPDKVLRALIKHLKTVEWWQDE